MKFIIAVLIAICTFFSFNANAQNTKAFEYAFSMGDNNTTISKGMKGFFIQNSLAKNIWKNVDLRVTIGFAKSSNYPKRFSYELEPFKIQDTIGGWNRNLDLWELVKKNESRIYQFDLTQATNLYINFNADIQLFKIKKFSFKATIGTNLISTFGSVLYPKTIGFNSNGEIVAFTPTVDFYKDNLMGFNLGFKFNQEINNNWGVHILIDKYFGDNSNSGYAKSEWINVGAGISKFFYMQKKVNTKQVP